MLTEKNLISLSKKIILLVISIVLVACGGGSEDIATNSSNLNSNNQQIENNPEGGSTSLPVEQLPTSSTEVAVQTTFKNTLKDLSSTWSEKVTIVNDTELLFDGTPSLKNGDIFVVDQKAYKVTNIVSNALNKFQVFVTTPAPNEVYEKIEISGKMDAIKFIPNPDLIDDISVSNIPQSIVAAQIAASTTSKELTLNTNQDGFYTATYSMNKAFSSNVTGQGTITFGAKADFNKWDVLTNTGYGQLQMYLSANALLRLKKTTSSNSGYEDGICSSKSDLRKNGRVLIGTIPLGKVISAIPGTQIVTSLVNINIPLCAVVNVSSNMSYDLFDLTGKFQAVVNVGNQQIPNVAFYPQYISFPSGFDFPQENMLPQNGFLNGGGLNFNIPASTATLASDAQLNASKTFSIDVKGEAGFEFGFEINDKFNVIANTGVSISALVKPSLTGTFGAELVSKNFSSLEKEGKACLELRAEAELQAKAFASSFWNKTPLLTTAVMPIMEPKVKKYGLCELDDLVLLSLTASKTRLDIGGETATLTAKVSSKSGVTPTGYLSMPYCKDSALIDKNGYASCDVDKDYLKGAAILYLGVGYSGDSKIKPTYIESSNKLIVKCLDNTDPKDLVAATSLADRQSIEGYNHNCSNPTLSEVDGTKKVFEKDNYYIEQDGNKYSLNSDWLRIVQLKIKAPIGGAIEAYNSGIYKFDCGAWTAKTVVISGYPGCVREINQPSETTVTVRNLQRYAWSSMDGFLLMYANTGYATRYYLTGPISISTDISKSTYLGESQVLIPNKQPDLSWASFE